MACERYEILLVDMQGRAKQKREWTEAQLLGSVAWLKRMNARGHDVLVRPASRSGLVLLDGLTQSEVSELERGGVPCSAKIQVGGNRYEVWINLGTEPLRGTLQKGLANSPRLERFKFGALGGFVHHQPKAQGAGDAFVLVHEPAQPGPEAIGRWQRVLAAVSVANREKGISEESVLHKSAEQSR